ncbi:hypothetical protein D5086_025650 [Populus alba]|uniref:Uncharacterized protein n=1 Tax=Populus alba TaxID=43335 RepID=A0ACC4B0H7_POPAL
MSNGDEALEPASLYVNWDDRVQERDSVAAVQLPANSMEAPSELVGGQAVQPSAAETKKAKRLWMEDTQKQFKKLKANYAKLVKSEASSSEILDRLKNDFEKAREAKRLQEQKVEQQNLMINTLQQLLQLPFEMTEGETGLHVHHPPVYQSGTVEESKPASKEEESMIRYQAIQWQINLNLSGVQYNPL